jgi:hypothetical protein
MQPPVAVLAYNVEEPQQAVFYPFAPYSPEWLALTYGVGQHVPVWFMDLPVAHSFALQKVKAAAKEAAEAASPSVPEDTRDPMSYLAEIAGYADSEDWWEHHFEQNYLAGEATAHFEAVALSMEALREHLETPSRDRDDLREAYMRRLIRKAEKENYRTIAVICGAWHAPALRDLKSTAKADEQLLKGLPKVPVSTTWIPWTNSRLGLRSGYGAGIVSPGWYEHCWQHPDDLGVRWLTRVAKLFRGQKMDTSTAHVIEAYRLAESLAALRGRSRPGLQELNEATQTVICFGDAVLLKLVEEELIVARNLGKVPGALPKLPLQADFETYQRKYRLELGETRKEYELDLRKELDLNRSKFLHRLQILGIGWGRQHAVGGKGTFKEAWTLRWEPEMMVRLIEMGIWGNTVEDACGRRLLDESGKSGSITQIAGFIGQAIPAELFGVIEKLLRRINELATVSSDILELMGALVPLVDVTRYGNVRKTDLSALNYLVEGLVTRICIGLPNACYGLDEATAMRMFGHIRKVDEAVRLLENESMTATWHATLRILLDKAHIQAVITGCTCRLLFDSQVLDAGDTLWNLLHRWVAALDPAQFTELMPILRRTFSQFDPGERRKLGEKAKRGTATAHPAASPTTQDHPFDDARAAGALPVIAQLLGIGH